MLMSSTMTPNPLAKQDANSISSMSTPWRGRGERHQRERHGEHEAPRHVDEPGAEPRR